MPPTPEQAELERRRDALRMRGVVTTMESVIFALEDAGLAVVPPCRSCPIGLADRAESVDVVVTGLGRDHDGAAEVDAVRRADPPGVAYVERSGRVWLLADGPTSGTAAKVYVGAYRDADVSDLQGEVAELVAATLAEFYGLNLPDPPDDATVATEGNPPPVDD